MAFTTSWSVTDLSNKQYGDFTNITQVGVKCIVTEGSYNGEWTSRYQIGTADTTAAKCLEWVKVAMGSTAMSDAQAWGKMMIEEQKANSTKNNVGVVTNTVPWS